MAEPDAAILVEIPIATSSIVFPPMPRYIGIYAYTYLQNTIWMSGTLAASPEKAKEACRHTPHPETIRVFQIPESKP